MPDSNITLLPLVLMYSGSDDMRILVIMILADFGGLILKEPFLAPHITRPGLELSRPQYNVDKELFRV